MKTKLILKTLLFLLAISPFLIDPLMSQEIFSRPKLKESSIKDVIANMTLEEKASLVCGAGINLPPEVADFLGDEMKKMIPQPGSLASKMKNPVLEAAGYTIEIPELGIPNIVVNDGPAGLRMMGGNYECTGFPIGTLLASTWDTDLIFKVGQAYGNETLEYGVDILLAPGMNIQRNPLCGRNFEYYSEDPLLSGKIGAAIVKGIQSQGVGTSVKHFIANNQETDRKSVDAVISERALREIYLEGFRIAIQEAEPWTVMSSYNLVNGIHTSENPELLKTILRDEWGFKGMVTSDWISGNDFVAQVQAGNDLLMPGPYQVNTIIQAVKDGQLSEKVLDINIENILKLALKTPRFNNYVYSKKPNTAKNIEVSRKVATEGMILLKNEGSALPFNSEINNVALFGNASYETYTGGSGSGSVVTTYKINLVDGLQNFGYQLDDALQEEYATYMSENKPKPTNMLDAGMGRGEPAPEMPLNISFVEKMADDKDIALLTIGRKSGETADRHIENDFCLSDIEKSNLELVTRSFHKKGKKVIVILNIGGVIETASWKNLPDAILLAWQPGMEAGNAIVDVLSGKVNPSGKLAVSFPVLYTDVPSSENFPGKVVTDDTVVNRRVIYEEDIYVGYRYYNTFNVETSYPFGYGLSYTSFSYDKLKISRKTFKDDIAVQVTVTNTGNTAGKEIVELYLHAPKKELDKPLQELKGFAKTKLLEPGESQEITFYINSRNLASFNTDESAWIADAGKYEIKIGASNEDIKLSESFRLAKKTLVEKVNKALVPQLKINESKNK